MYNTKVIITIIISTVNREQGTAGKQVVNFIFVLQV